MYHTGQVSDNNPTGVCYDCGNDAFIKVVGECDSFGHETIVWCKACYDNYQDYRKQQRSEQDAKLIADYESAPTREV